MSFEKLNSTGLYFASLGYGVVGAIGVVVIWREVSTSFNAWEFGCDCLLVTGCFVFAGLLGVKSWRKAREETERGNDGQTL